MSLLQHPDSIVSQNLQIWNNAAFDDIGAGGGNNASANKLVVSSPLRPISINLAAASLDPDPSKENRSPGSPESPRLLAKKCQPPAPVKPFGSKLVSKKPAKVVAFKEEETETEPDDDGGGDIDGEIDNIKKEIARLSLRLEKLQIKKVERDSRATAAALKRGRFVPAKFMDPKHSALATPVSRKFEGTPARLGRRGMSLGPLEIIATPAKTPVAKQRVTTNLWPSALKKIEESSASVKVRQRGVSLGPLEIHESTRLGQSEKPKGTPLKSAQSCRKSGFRKIGGIEEQEVTKEKERCSSRPSLATAKTPTAFTSKKIADTPANGRTRQRGLSLGPSEIVSNSRGRHPYKLQETRENGVKNEKGGRSLSTSPKPRRASVAKALELRNSIATVAAKKQVKREDQSQKPKSLFQDTVKEVPGRRAPKSAKVRVVASRYSLASARIVGDDPGSKRRKWSLPEIGKLKNKEALRGSAESMPECKAGQGFKLQEQVKKECEIPDNLDGNVSSSSSIELSPQSITKVACMLPKITTLRSNMESPRDSGCAKRVAELVGRRSFFAVAEDEELSSSYGQVLAYQEDE